MGPYARKRKYKIKKERKTKEYNCCTAPAACPLWLFRKAVLQTS